MLGSISLTTGPFVAVDIETTGPRPGSSSIIDIGAVRILEGRIVGYFSTLVSPEVPIPAVIEQLTGISNNMVSLAPPVSDAISRFRTFAEGAVLVAHGHRFDMSFLDYEAERVWGIPFPRPVLDTLTLARHLHPELHRHNLRDLSTFYDTGALPNHRALPDALATAEILLRMVPELTAEGLLAVRDAAAHCGSARHDDLAAKLPLATHIPDGPGVYWFRNAVGTVVLVGRAKNLRTRIRGHFYALGESTSGPAAEATSISYVPCASGLDAALIEARLQTRYSGTLDRHSRRSVLPVYLHVDADSDYPALRVTRRRLRNGVIVGPLSNEHSARVLADTLNVHFGLRRCRRPVHQCANRPCSPNDAARCGAPDIYALGPEAYAKSLTAALAVLDGGGEAFRELLRTRQEEAAQSERFEEASQCRDAIRALDRTLAALAVAERASADRVCVLIEGDDANAAVLVVANGWLFTTLRPTRAEVASGCCTRKLVRAVARATQRSVDAHLTVRHYQDTVIIDTYRQQHDVACVTHSGDPVDTAERATTVLRRMMRIPRKHHGAVSTG